MVVSFLHLGKHNMKYYRMKLVTLIIIVLSSLPALAQGVKINIPDSAQNCSPQTAKIEFVEQEYDFGTFQPAGKDSIKSHSFRFVNTGQRPLVIHHVASGCGCTRPSYTKTPIQPGDSGIVTVNYKGYGQPFGKFRKSVTVYSNDPRSYTRIFIRGELKKYNLKPAL